MYVYSWLNFFRSLFWESGIWVVCWLILHCSVDEIAKLFPCLFGQPSAVLVPGDGKGLLSGQNLKIGVVLSGGQAPGGHNVISGIYGSIFDLGMLLTWTFMFKSCSKACLKFIDYDP